MTETPGRGTAPPRHLQERLVAALRGAAPAGGDPEEVLEPLLRRYECGGWLHALWRERSPAGLPDPWRNAVSRAHRRTLVDTLAALGGLREIAPFLAGTGAPFILMKGAAYLAELYPDPGTRALTDVDLLVPSEAVSPLARRLAGAGFRGLAGPHYPEDCRFEMFREGPAACRFEIHWRLGSAGRMRFDMEGVWRRSREAILEGVPCRLLSPEDTLLYHAGHAADHYFGPTLKWAIDLREMLRRFAPDPASLAARARAAGIGTALQLALLQVEGLMPGSVTADLLQAVPMGPLRRAAIGWARSPGPAEFLRLGSGDRARVLLRPFLFDSAADATSVAATVALRPAARLRRRSRGRAAMPWEPGAVLE